MPIVLYLFVIALFIGLTGFRLLAPGMFLDGVTYAAISRNLAMGQGSFWEPFYTSSLYPRFHEHPPLGIGMESLAFRIFGDHLWVERIYSAGAFIITGFLIVRIWQTVTGKRNSGWLPLLVWILFPLVTWAAAANLLDNTLMICTTVAILLIVKAQKRHRPVLVVIAGFSLFAGMLVKGPFALFPWAMPVIWGIFNPGSTPKKILSDTLVLIFSTLSPLVVVMALSPAAASALHTYWTNQVVGSITGVTTVGSRFYILVVWLLQLAIPLLLVFVLALRFRKAGFRERWKAWYPDGLRWFLLGLAGVVPVMISLKQSSYYILPALPAFAVSIAMALKTTVPQDYAKATPGAPRSLRFAVILLLALSVGVSPVLAHLNRKDRPKVEMVRAVSRLVPPGSVIGISPDDYSDWSLHAYFMRLGRISLDPSPDGKSRFFLVREADHPTNPGLSAGNLLIRENGYLLFRK
jgi:4-amino-4-deoxy-L-arabinose transferase-like glycosyltransferase